MVFAAIFLETAENEKAHASRWFNFLGDVRTTVENLDSAALGENYEHTVMKSTEVDCSLPNTQEVFNLQFSYTHRQPPVSILHFYL